MIEFIKSLFKKDEDVVDGCLWDWAKSTDYILTEWIMDWLPSLVQQDVKRFYYNQANQGWSKQSCTIFWAIWAVSDLMNYEFPLSQIKEIDEYSYTTNKYNKNAPRTRWKGWYVGFAVDLVRNRWNDQPDLVAKYWKLASYQIDMSDDVLIEEAIKKNYNIDTGYYGNAKYNLDYQSDCILDGTEFGTQTYWHCINVIWTNASYAVKDNYFGKKYNLYLLRHKPREIKCWHNCGYLFTKVNEENADEIKRLNEMKTKLEQNIENNSALWHLTNDKKYQEELHRQNEFLRSKLNDVEVELKKYL